MGSQFCDFVFEIILMRKITSKHYNDFALIFRINLKPQARTGNAKSVNDSTCIYLFIHSVVYCQAPFAQQKSSNNAV